MMCFFGRGVPQDYAQAAVWLQKAAEQGNAEAQYNLGVSYSRGVGVTRNVTQAVAWYRKAAEQGHPESRYNLGAAYRRGRGVEQDPALAYLWFSLAASGSTGKARDESGRSREKIGSMLDPGQQEKAQQMIREWEERRPRK